MASTYRSPETVVVSEAAQIVDTIDSLSSTFLKTAGNIKAIKDKKVKQAQEFNQRLIKDISIDPTAFYKALGESNANRALFDQVNRLMDNNAKLQLDIEAGLYSQSDYRDLMASKNKTIAELSQLVGLAEGEKTSKISWIENAEDRINNLTNQGGDSLVGNTEYINAKNIFSEMSKGSVKRIFKGNVMYYEIQGEGLDKPYEVPAAGFLSKQLFKVPNFDKEYKNMLIQKGILTSTGAKTEYFKNMSAAEFERDISEIIDAKVLGAIKDRRVANSMYVEIFGGEKPFEQYGGGDENHYAGSTISNADAERLREAMFKYAMNITPKWQAKAPKELSDVDVRAIKTQNLFDNNVKEWEDKFKRTISKFKSAFNPAGVMTGQLDIFEKVQNEDGETVEKLRPDFVEALSYLNGMTIKSINPGEAKISGGGLKGDFTVTQNLPISVFVENLHKNIWEQNKLYDAKTAGKFAYQFKPELPSR